MGKVKQNIPCGPLLLAILSMYSQLFFDFGIWIFPKWELLVQLLAQLLHAFVMLLICINDDKRKPKFHPYFKRFSWNEIKESHYQKNY